MCPARAARPIPRPTVSSKPSGPTQTGKRCANAPRVPWWGGAPPMSLYAHIPFGGAPCYCCACNKIITRHHSWGREYLQLLEQEVALHAAELGKVQTIKQLHLGGR